MKRVDQKGGEYHCWRSNTMMNDKRYKLNGIVHRNGTDATFCVSWLVVAINKALPVAEREIQRERVCQLLRMFLVTMGIDALR